jgi:hypothetical protein
MINTLLTRRNPGGENSVSAVPFSLAIVGRAKKAET